MYLNSLQQWPQTKRPFRASQSKPNKQGEWQILSWRMNRLQPHKPFKIHYHPNHLLSKRQKILHAISGYIV